MEVNMTVGKPYRSIVPFALYSLVGNLVLQLYNVIDSVIVGAFNGENAVAAIGAITPINFMFVGFISGLTSGIGIQLAGRFGARDEEGFRQHVGMTIMIGCVISVLMTLLLLLLNAPMLRLLKTPDAIFSDSLAYLNILYAGIFVCIGFNICIAIMRSVGDSRSPLLFYLAAAITNMGLDYLFVGVMKGGVRGAAYATILAQGIFFVIQMWYLFKRFSLLKLSRRHLIYCGTCIKSLLAQGVPMGVQYSITAIGTLVVQAALNTYGPEAIAGFSAANKVQLMGFQVFLAWSLALSTFIGQNRGAGLYGRIRIGARQTISFGLVCSVLLMGIYALFGRDLVALFSRDASHAMMEAGWTYFMVSIWFYPCLAVLLIYRNALQGLGFSALAMVAGIVEMFARISVILFLSGPFGFAGVCFSDGAAWLCAAVALTIWFHQKLKSVEKLRQLRG